jgi:hypothetical protein
MKSDVSPHIKNDYATSVRSTPQENLTKGDTTTPHSSPEGAAEHSGSGMNDPSARKVRSQIPPKEAIHQLPELIAELKEFASHYIGAKIDGIKLSIFKIGVYTALGVVGLLVGCATVFTAVTLILIGLASGLAHLFGDPPRYWLGSLVVGVAVISMIGIAAFLVLRRITARHRKVTMEKYERRQQWQHSYFG